MDINIAVKNNIIYFDYGYVRQGDIIGVIAELDNYIGNLSKPFQTISIYDRAIEKNSLPISDDREGINKFSDFLEKQGRDLSVWVISENNMLFTSLLNIAKNKEFVKVAKSVEDAEQIIIDHRLQ